MFSEGVAMKNAIRLVGLVVLLAAGCRGSSGDDDDDTGTPDAAGGGQSIYDVQNDAMAVGTAVTLEGVVVTAIDNYGARSVPQVESAEPL